MTTATLDTNVFPAGALVERARQVGIQVAAITVSYRGVEGSPLEDEVRCLATVLEIAVWGESWWGHSVFGSLADADRLERVLGVLSNGAFPHPGNREHLSSGQRRQLRDAMILSAHLRSNRDILVSNDRKAFVSEGRRERIEAEYGTRVMMLEEFEAHLSELEGHAAL